MVSIHAPVKGATPRRRLLLGRLDVSIHAPVKGATGRRATTRRASQRFNPRARKGRDTALPADEPRYAVFQSTRP